MFSLELGQTKSVLILYFVTFLFSLCSYLYLYDRIAASILFITLMVLFEIFVEATSMIGRKYKPLLTIANIFIKSEYLPSIKDSKPYRRVIKKVKKQYLAIIVLIFAIVFSLIFIIDINSNYRENIGELVGTYFVCDYYTLTNKSLDQIGGVNYFYSDKKDDFETYAKNDYYKEVNTYINNKENTQEVKSYNIISYEQSSKALKGLDDYNYYDLTIEINFGEYNSIIKSDVIIR